MNDKKIAGGVERFTGALLAVMFYGGIAATASVPWLFRWGARFYPNLAEHYWLNTVLFMGALILLYGNTQYLTDLIAGRNIIVFVCTFVGINAVAELVVSTLVTGALCTALERARLMGGQR